MHIIAINRLSVSQFLNFFIYIEPFIFTFLHLQREVFLSEEKKRKQIYLISDYIKGEVIIFHMTK